MFFQQFYTIKDLRAWSRKEPSLGVVGFPVKHSASPPMQNAALEQFAEFKDWRYFRFEIEDKDLKEALRIFGEKNFIGLNLTVPHKVMAYHMIDQRDESSETVQAANTLLFDWPGSGSLPEGYSTDGYGLLKGLETDLSFDPQGKTVLLLGAGGAGQTAAITLEKQGAEVLWHNRTPQKVAALIPGLGLENTYMVNPGQIAWEQIDLVVNSTSAGLGEKPVSPLDFGTVSGHKESLCAYDMLYGKDKTAFISGAESLGIHAAGGLSMLLHQGAKAFEIWTKKQAPLEVMGEALKKAIYGIK
ncbi:MAG: shikimate dehydrogenase [Verrucomicrobiota bacterium]|nr:shikimate dehydrogenase [Verrucomicrobiota bacterium]